MKNTIILTDDEALRLKSGDTMTLFRPLGEQPPDDYELSATYTEEAFYVTFELMGVGITIPLQYPVGEYGIRETWAYDRILEEDEHYKPVKATYFYKSDGLNQDVDWYSPATMPSDAIRGHLIVLEDTAKRVQNISINDIRAEGVCDTRNAQNEIVETYEEKWIQLWDSLNAKRGYPYEKNPWNWVLELSGIEK